MTINSLFALVSCKNKQEDKIKELSEKVEKLSKEIESLSENMNQSLVTQTAIFYRVLGEALPVIVPGEFPEKLSSITLQIEECIKNISAYKYDTAEKQLLGFLTTTPPWIQEELFSEIKYAKQSLEYARILCSHQNDNDYFDSFIGELNTYIHYASEYPHIEDVKNKKNEIISKKEEKIRQEVLQFKEKILAVSINYNLTENEFENLMKNLSDYEIFLAENGKNEYAEDFSDMKNKISESKQKYDDKIEYEKYISDFNEFEKQARNFSYSIEEYNKLKNIIPVIKSKHPERKDDDEILYELTVFVDLKEALSKTRKELEEKISDFENLTADFLTEKEGEILVVENKIHLIKFNNIINLSTFNREISELRKLISDARDKINLEAALKEDKKNLLLVEKTIEDVSKLLESLGKRKIITNEKIFTEIEKEISKAEKIISEIKHSDIIDLNKIRNDINNAKKLLSEYKISTLQIPTVLIERGPQNFYISKYEVTQDIYETVMGTNPSIFKGKDLPVENISFYDAIEFCNKLSLAQGLEPYYYNFTSSTPKENPAANGYRLPTPEEWKFAAKGYAGSSNITEFAWVLENSDNKTHPVGAKAPNELGLYDMYGNVWEYCFTSFGYPTTPPQRFGGSFLYRNESMISSIGTVYATGIRLARNANK